MASIFENKDRRVIPNFRSLNYTQSVGDFDFSKASHKIPVLNDNYFVELKKEWGFKKNIGLAADIVSCGLVVEPADSVVKSAAEFVLKSLEASNSLKSIAKIILNGDTFQNSNPNHLKWSINNNNLPYI